LKDLQFRIYELRLDYEMLRQAQHDKIVGKLEFGVDRHTDLKDLKDLQFGIYELRLDYEMLRQAQHDKIVGMLELIGTQI
jgi:hypothetical protein